MTGRLIRLSTPGVCVECGKVIRAGRLAFWEMATLTCYGCFKKQHGEAEIDEAERAILEEFARGRI